MNIKFNKEKIIKGLVYLHKKIAYSLNSQSNHFMVLNYTSNSIEVMMNKFKNAAIFTLVFLFTCTLNFSSIPRLKIKLSLIICESAAKATSPYSKILNIRRFYFYNNNSNQEAISATYRFHSVVAF